MVSPRPSVRLTSTRSTRACLTALNSSSRTASKSKTRTSLAVGFASGVGGDIDYDVVLPLRLLCQPCQSGRQTGDMEDGRKEVRTQRACRSDRFLDVITSPLE